MAYAKTVWEDGVTQANAANLNHLEDGVAANDTAIAGKANASHTHTSTQVTDFAEATQDAMNSAIVVEGGLTKVYDDVNGTLTLGTTGVGSATDPEVVRDTVATAARTTGIITFSADDTADTLTWGSTATTVGTAVVQAVDATAARSAISAAAATHTHTTANVTGLDAELQRIDAVLYYGTGAVPLRNTRTSDTTRPVRWRGSTQPPTTAGYALAIDIWESTT